MKHKPKALIFDFDGVIADSFDWFAKFLADEAKKLPLPENELANLRGLSLKAAALELGHSWWRLPGLYYFGRRELSHHIDELKVFGGVAEVLRQLNDVGYQPIIVSSNSRDNIEHFLINNGLKNCFGKVYGNIGFGGKARILRRIIRKNELPASETYYVCDEVRDLLAARSAHVKTIAVTWGYNNRKNLLRHKPNRIISRPNQLIDVIS